MAHIVYDVLGIGFGPGNIALAIALQEQFPDVRAHFIEAGSASHWQSSMMIGDADIQHNPIMDLVTPRNPQSHFTFINYLHKKNRLFQHSNLGLEFPLRREYADYVLWASRFFDDIVDYDARAACIEIDRSSPSNRPLYVVVTTDGRAYRARTLVLATGRTPFVPDVFHAVPESRRIHLTQYLDRMNALGPDAKSVAVIGSSQSAVEILLDLVDRFPHLQVTNYIRHFGYRQKDLSPQMEASIYPEFVKEHYDRTWDDRQRFNNDLKYQNYSSSDKDVLIELNKKCYVSRLKDDVDLYELMNNAEIMSCEYDRTVGKIEIRSRQIYKKDTSIRRFDLVVLATGFKNMGVMAHEERIPPMLNDISEEFEHDDHGVVRVTLDYALMPVSSDVPPLYLNGLCEGTHGVSDAGSFSLLALRSQKIAGSLVEQLSAQRAMAGR